MADRARRRGGPTPVDVSRRTHSVRIPEDHYEDYERIAREAGLSLGDYLVRELALAHGLDVPGYIQKRQRKALANRTDQQELPISA